MYMRTYVHVRVVPSHETSVSPNMPQQVRDHLPRDQRLAKIISTIDLGCFVCDIGMDFSSADVYEFWSMVALQCRAHGRGRAPWRNPPRSSRNDLAITRGRALRKSYSGTRLEHVMLRIVP